MRGMEREAHQRWMKREKLVKLEMKKQSKIRSVKTEPYCVDKKAWKNPIFPWDKNLMSQHAHVCTHMA